MDPLQLVGAEAPQEIALVLKTINDETFGVHMRRDALISELKAKVKVTTQVPEDRQRLIYRGRVLEDTQPLSAYNVEDGHTIHVVARPNPPPISAPAEATRPSQRDVATHEASQMSGFSSLAESLLARTAGAAGRRSRDQGSQAPDNLEHIRQSMLTMLTLMSTMSTVSARDFHDNGAAQETKQTEQEAESKESATESNNNTTSTTTTTAGTVARSAQRQFFVGQWLDVKDTVDQWLEATVLDINDGKVLIHYNGWPSRWDEWIDFSSPRIAPFRTRTSHVLSTVSNSPSPVTVAAHAPTTGVNDMRLVLPEVVAMAKLMTARLEELSQLYTEHWVHDPDNEQFSRGGPETVATNLPWSTARPEPLGDGDFPREKEARMNVLAAELAPLCDRFGRAVVDLAPQLQRLAPNDQDSSEASDEDDSTYNFLARALGRGRRRNIDTPASTDRAYRQIISSTTRGNSQVGNHLDIHIHAILTPTSAMFGNTTGGGAAGGAGAGGATERDAAANRGGASSGRSFAQMNAFRSLADLQGLNSNRSSQQESAAAAAPHDSDRREEGIAFRGGSAMRRLFYPQPRTSSRVNSASGASTLASPAPAPASTTSSSYWSALHPPPPPPSHPAPAPPAAAHDDLEVLAPSRPPLPPRATSDSFVAAAAASSHAVAAPPHTASADPQQAANALSAPAAADPGPGLATTEDSAAAAANHNNNNSNNNGGGGLLRAVLRRWSRTFSPQGPN